MKHMVIIKNGEGRPCGWGMADTKTRAQEIAQDFWDDPKHCCYPGEVQSQIVHYIRKGNDYKHVSVENLILTEDE